MYESPITQIVTEIQTTYENECLKVVKSYGFDVNKEEITKALMYDRNQYEKGYKQAIEYVKNLITERLQKNCNRSSCDDCEECCEVAALMWIDKHLN